MNAYPLPGGFGLCGRGAVSDLATWTGVVVAVVAAVLAWLTYRSQRGKKGLEYLIVSSQRLVSPRAAADLTVSFDGRPVDEPSLTVLRVVSTGDKGISSDSFESPLIVLLRGATKVVSASVSATRPNSLPIALRADGIRVVIEPLLLNPRDFIEVQALTDGHPDAVIVEARIADVTPRRRSQLPYPPGSGPEGQMLGMDKFMWTVPEAIIAAVVVFAVVASDLSTVATVAWTLTVLIVAGGIYPLWVRRLVKRRRAWRLWTPAARRVGIPSECRHMPGSGLRR